MDILKKNCKHKDEEIVCAKCSQNHSTNDCKTDRKDWRCQNCIRFKMNETDHCVNSRYCHLMQNEIKKVAEMTDHGY